MRTRRAIHDTPNKRIVVELREEFRGLDIVADLCKLESDRTSHLSLLNLGVHVAHAFHKRVRRLARRLAVGDADDEDRLLELVSANLGHDKRIEDSLTEPGAERCESLVTFGAHDLIDLLFGTDAAKLIQWDGLVVHEADLDAIVVEERRGESSLSMFSHTFHVRLSHCAMLTLCRISWRSLIRSPFSSKDIDPLSSI